MAVNKEKIEQALTKTKSVMILISLCGLCISFMLLTQLTVVKNLPYLIQNLMTLLTCLPAAVGIILFGKSFSELFENQMLIVIGRIAYEIYLVHAFTLRIVKPSIIDILLFIVTTYVLAYILHIGVRKVKNGRFNCNYTDEK